MVNLKTILDTRRAKADGSFTILFRVTNHKDVKYIASGFSVFENQWDVSASSLNKHHPNAGSINSLISKRFYEIQKVIVGLEDKDEYTYETLKEIINPKPVETKIQKAITFKQFSQEVMDEMIIIKRTGGALVYLTAVNRLIEYSNNQLMTFEDINYAFLEGFKNKLLKDGLKKNSVGNYFRSIRALYNKAIKSKVVSRELYPFHDISIKTEKPAKRAISARELSDIYNFPRKECSQEWDSGNYFFLSFALRGMSFTDMAYLKTENITKGYITYRRRKTKKLYTIKLHPVAIRILSNYKNNNNGYLLPIFPKNIIEDSENATKVTRQWIKTTNKYLNRIAKSCGFEINVTTYVIRHTWATTAKRLGFSNEMIAEAMGHEYGNKITNIYLDDFDQTLIDGMNDKVIISIIPCLKRIKTHVKFVLRPSVDLHKYKMHKTSLSLDRSQRKV
jgi:integrase/recombinase XerD